MKLFDLIKKKLFKKQHVKTGDHLVDFYNRIDEDSRLLSKHGQIEFLTTVKYIEKYLKDGMKIIEIGAATGRYSHYFAQKGFEVDAVELIEHNIEIFKAKTLPDEEVTIRQGNAINLAEYPDGNYDVTLLLGPMYHLYTVEEQKKALSEAIRITKPDGYIFVAYCMVDPSVLTGIFKNNKVQQSIDDGLINTETFETYFPPHGVFKLYTRDEIFELTEELNAERLHFLATDGYTLHMRDVIDKMDNETYELYLKYHFKTCERQDLVGTSHHTLDVLRKEQTL
ncbi:MAG: class I SAM-dependent methyltransferase [Ruminococcaceae bacterium]|nr:class I SAM-dependent methyltransferase [Oscillospiraceae bacterium]